MRAERRRQPEAGVARRAVRRRRADDAVVELAARPRPTSWRATPGAAAGNACARRRGRAALRSSRRLRQQRLEPAVDRLARDRRDRGLRRGGEPSSQPRFAEDPRRSQPRARPARPGATSRPFSPSRTTSGTPPTAVETTGTPTDSASTAECGRFSQSLESSAASAPATMRSASSRDSAPRNEIRSPAPESAAAPVEARALGAVADEDKPRLGHAGDRVDRGRRAPSAASAGRRRRTSPAPAARALDLARRRRRVRQHVQPVAAKTPAGRDLGEIRARDDDRPCARRSARVRSAFSVRTAGARRVLELLERARGSGRSVERARRPGRRRASRRAAAARHRRQPPRPHTSPWRRGRRRPCAARAPRSATWP